MTERKLNRKERRTNLANVRKQRRKFMRTRGPSVAPPEGEHLNKEAPINQGVEANE